LDGGRPLAPLRPNPAPTLVRLMEFHLSVNGDPVTVDVLEDTPLLWVLRDALALTGTKYGCGIGRCGACTVHLDGAAVRSCQIPVRAVGEAEVTTIEGLDPDGAHPVQQAWVEEDVPQCGYCQAGQIMNAAALLAGDPDADADTLEAAMSGNLCRCGTYVRIRAAVLRAAREARGLVDLGSGSDR